MKTKQIYLFLFVTILLTMLLLVACGGSAEVTPAATTVEPTKESVEPATKEPAKPTESDEPIEGIPAPTTLDDVSGATIYVYDFGTMTLHAFVNPPEAAGNGTCIIEGENSLVLIDSHFDENSAKAFRAYADNLGKPIDSIYLTHEHPDHINGLGVAFTDVESYATAEVVELAAQAGIEIGNIVEAGNAEIDGIAYEFEIFQDTESEEALLIKLPEYGVMAAGDLIYNNYHMVMNPNIPNWLDQLAQMEAMDEYELILLGHGEPTDPTVYAASVDYLETALAFYNEIDDPDEFQSALIEAYPDRRAPFFLGLTAQRMYPKSDVGNGLIDIPDPTTVDDASGATIYVYDFGTMTLHAFVNPPEAAGNGTCIIEGENSLVLIDSHFDENSAKAFRAYADNLGKPIDSIYLTHEHPDHINGLGVAFTDVESYATAEVVELAAQAGIEIGNIVEAGNAEIDGIAYEFEIFQDTESEEALLIKLPEYGVMAAGDLIYNNYHMVMNPNIPNWLDQLAQMEAMDEYELILPGHGEPVDPTVYAASMDYLETALALYNEIDDPDEFQAALIEAYPERRAPFFLGLAAQRMYPKQ